MDVNSNKQSDRVISDPEVMEEIKVGHVVKSIIHSIDENIIRVLIGSRVFCLPVTEVSWTSKKAQLKENDEIEAVVVKIEPDGLVVLSVKRLQEDPWSRVKNQFFVGMKLKGKIQRVLPFGLSIELGDSVSALLHRKTIGFEKGVNFFDYILIGNMLEVEISEIDMESRKIYLKCDSFLEQYPKRNK